ncbi:MAG: hypothetical protein RLZZ200_2985 [Pseudomonadota bacterium]|jgi:hypothetical protein
MDEYVCKIEKLANGYEVIMADPAIVKANASSKGSWRDPNIGHAFKDVDEVCAFLKANLDKAGAGDEYSSSFDAAVAEEGDD